MITMAQRPIDQDPTLPTAQMAVDPHATLTAPISPAPMPTMAVGKPSSPKMALAPQEEHISKNLMADYQKDADPYGSPDNHPGFFGKFLHGLNVATGGVNRRGFEEQGLENRLQDIGKEESTENEQAAHAKDLTSEANARDNPQPDLEVLPTDTGPDAFDRHSGKATPITGPDGRPVQQAPKADLASAYANAVTSALNAGRDPGSDPVVQHLADAITSIQKQPTEAGGPKTIQKQVNGKPHTFAFDPNTKDYTKDEGETGEKPPVVNANAGNAALDRESARFARNWEAISNGANAQLDKITDAESMIGGNAEAQALGIPKVLTALISGQGSGVRITQSEINQIAHARGWKGDFEGTLNTISGEGSLSGTQQQQLRGILEDVKQRIIQKQNIANEASDRINNGASREEIIQADKEARDKLSAFERGAPPPPKAGDVVDGHKFKGGDPSDPKNWVRQ